MKSLITIVLFTFCITACKKKENKDNAEPLSKGNFLVVAVSDDVDYAIEYKVNSPLDSMPMVFSAYQIDPVTLMFECYLGMKVPGWELSFFKMNFIPMYTVNQFPTITTYVPYVDSIPGSELQHTGEKVNIDSTEIKILSDPSEYHLKWDRNWGPAWDKISDLKLVRNYRIHYPNSKVGFINFKHVNGENRRFFFMVKV